MHPKVNCKKNQRIYTSIYRGKYNIIYNRNRNLQTSKMPLESQAQGTSLFTSAAIYAEELAQIYIY